ncbi:MAG: hypothetical protein Q9181_008045 [Wetmoreana brouardii]
MDVDVEQGGGQPASDMAAPSLTVTDTPTSHRHTAGSATTDVEAPEITNTIDAASGSTFLVSLNLSVTAIENVGNDPATTAPDPPNGILRLPPEIQCKIYELAMIPGSTRSPHWSASHTKTHFDYLLPQALMLTSRQVKAEVTQYYFEKVYTHIFVNNLCRNEPYFLTMDSSGGPLTKRAVLVPPPTSIKCWCLHLVCNWKRDQEHDSDESFRKNLIDSIVSLLAKSGQAIKSLVVQIPCLCSRAEWVRNKTFTLDSWAATILPPLLRLSPLRIGGTVAFVPTRQEPFPACPLRRCKALIDHLEDLSDTIEGKTAAANGDPQAQRGQRKLDPIQKLARKVAFEGGYKANSGGYVTELDYRAGGTPNPTSRTDPPRLHQPWDAPESFADPQHFRRNPPRAARPQRRQQPPKRYW